MCLEKLRQLLLNPVSVIQKSKNPNEVNETIKILATSWALIGLSVMVLAKGLPLQMSLGSALIVFSIGMASTVFGAFLLQIVMTNLGSKGKYYHGLTALTFAKFPIAVGLFLSTILLQLNVIGFVLSIIVILIFFAMGISTLYRAIKDLFAVDIVTAWIGISILMMSLVIAVYVLMFGIVSQQGLVPSMMGYKMMYGY